jgi:DNA-binding FadR family transcriptional regulator
VHATNNGVNKEPNQDQIHPIEKKENLRQKETQDKNNPPKTNRSDKPFHNALSILAQNKIHRPLIKGAGYLNLSKNLFNKMSSTLFIRSFTKNNFPKMIIFTIKKL